MTEEQERDEGLMSVSVDCPYCDADLRVPVRLVGSDTRGLPTFEPDYRVAQRHVLAHGHMTLPAGGS